MGMASLVAGAACAVLALLLLAGRLDVAQVVLDAKVPPGARLLADALRDVAKAEDGKSHAARSQEAAKKKAPDGASVHGLTIRETGLERLAMGMQEKMTPLSSMPRHLVVDQTTLPAYGTQAWKIAKAKADVRVSALQLKVDKEQRRLDAEDARYSKLYKGPVGEQLLAKQQLEDRVKREVAQAQAMEARARKMSDNVVQDLNVKKGHIDIKQWYRSQAAFKSSQESTEAVKDAKRLWAKVMGDRAALHKTDSDEAFKLQTAQMERDEVRVDITKRDMSANKAKLHNAKTLLHALEGEQHQQKPQQQKQQMQQQPAVAGKGDSSKAVGSKGSPKLANQLNQLPATRKPAKTAAEAAAETPARATVSAAPKAAHATKRATKQSAAAVVRAAARIDGGAGKKQPATATKNTRAAEAHSGRHTQQKLSSTPQQKEIKRAKGSFAASFSRAVDAIGMPKIAVAEDKEADEGGSPGREMELASSATAVMTSHGIVDKPYSPSTSEEVAAMVYSASSQALHAKGAASAASTEKLPYIERSFIMNW